MAKESKEEKTAKLTAASRDELVALVKQIDGDLRAYRKKEDSLRFRCVLGDLNRTELYSNCRYGVNTKRLQCGLWKVTSFYQAHNDHNPVPAPHVTSLADSKTIIPLEAELARGLSADSPFRLEEHCTRVDTELTRHGFYAHAGILRLECRAVNHGLGAKLKLCTRTVYITRNKGTQEEWSIKKVSDHGENCPQKDKCNPFYVKPAPLRSRYKRPDDKSTELTKANDAGAVRQSTTADAISDVDELEASGDDDTENSTPVRFKRSKDAMCIDQIDSDQEFEADIDSYAAPQIRFTRSQNKYDKWRPETPEEPSDEESGDDDDNVILGHVPTGNQSSNSAESEEEEERTFDVSPNRTPSVPINHREASFEIDDQTFSDAEINEQKEIITISDSDEKPVESNPSIEPVESSASKAKKKSKHEEQGLLGQETRKIRTISRALKKLCIPIKWRPAVAEFLVQSGVDKVKKLHSLSRADLHFIIERRNSGKPEHWKRLDYCEREMLENRLPDKLEERLRAMKA